MLTLVQNSKSNITNRYLAKKQSHRDLLVDCMTLYEDNFVLFNVGLVNENSESYMRFRRSVTFRQLKIVSRRSLL